MVRSKDDFRPRLGRIRATGGAASKRYLGKLSAAMEKSRPGVFAKRSGARFTGARIGRGAGLGAAFASRHPFAGFRARRVAVKIRSVRLGGNGLAKAQAHLRYLQRDGAQINKDGEKIPGKLYGPDREEIDSKSFLEEGKDDRHQFRIILSPEDAGELADLNSFTRDVMAAAENDLATKLDWVAVNHFDTDHPHVHVVLRGKADDGKDLVIARNYITHGFRKRAGEIATLELGQRRDLEIAKGRYAEIDKERYTGLDRELTHLAKDDAIVFEKPRAPYERFRVKLLMARLRTLEKMNLAHRDKSGWHLSEEFEPTLKAMGRRSDIIRSMSAAMGNEFAPSTFREFGPETSPAKLIGCVVATGAADDAHDKRFLALDGVDGNQWHVAVDVELGAMPPKGAIVEVTRGVAAPKKSDLAIATIAERNDGIYSDQHHVAADPSASAEFRLAHKRRLEALRRTGIVERKSDGSWLIPHDYLERARQFELDRSASRTKVLSWVSLEQLPEARAQIFIDDVLERHEKLGAVDHKFGGDLNVAIAARRRWLLSQGLVTVEGDKFAIDRNNLRNIERGALNEAVAKIAKQNGKACAPAIEGVRVEGVYRRPVDLPSGRFAFIERSKQFTLVPWRAALEKRRGMEVSGVIKRGGVSWTFGKNRSGPMR
jgi:type IV secretory pathway VirD2 relaxase